ncbi:MAG: hydrogenase maturation protease [Sulfolobales archaeon]|nr:hydrogenase maturation protease [Sulfolobales archaeon]MDW8083336.1 hydrogenase maturation protease [Sulfolobales archaeon]
MVVIVSEEELKLFLERVLIPGESVVVGIGNELRCDDGFGVYLARSLSNLSAKYSKRKCLLVIEAGTAVESYLDILSTAKISLILDVVEAPIPLSEIVVLSRSDIPKYPTSLSTHTIGIDTLLSLVKSDIYVIGTRPICLDVRLGVTKYVAEAIRKIVKAFIYVLERRGCIKV